MTNLSDLFPAGAGKQVSFVADGAVGAAGKPVVLTALGKVAQVAESTSGATMPYGTSTGYTWSTAANSYQGSTVEFDPITAGRIGVSFINSSNYPCIIIGTRSTTSITWGTPVVIQSYACLGSCAFAFDSQNVNQVAVLYYFRASSGAAHGFQGRSGTISGTDASATVTFGAAAVLNGVDTASVNEKSIPPQSVVFDPSASGTVCFSYQDWSVTKTYLRSATISGNVLTMGTEKDLGTDIKDERYRSLIVNTSGTLALTYRSGTGSLPTSIITGGISGGTITTSAATAISSAGGAYTQGNFDPNNPTKLGVSYEDGTDGKVQIVTLNSASGGGSATITTGTEIVFSTANPPNSIPCFNPALDTEFVVSYRRDDTGYENDLAVVSCTYDKSSTSNTITVGTTYQVWDQSAIAYPRYDYAAGWDNGVFGITFIRDDNSDGTLLLCKASSVDTNLTSTNFIGISDAAILDTASGNVTIKGGIAVTGLSSLTPGSDYYAQTDGTISTSSSGDAVKIGKAMSATSINLEYQS
jgi:hypothetical protein